MRACRRMPLTRPRTRSLHISQSIGCHRHRNTTLPMPSTCRNCHCHRTHRTEPQLLLRQSVWRRRSALQMQDAWQKRSGRRRRPRRLRKWLKRGGWPGSRRPAGCRARRAHLLLPPGVRAACLPKLAPILQWHGPPRAGRHQRRGELTSEMACECGRRRVQVAGSGGHLHAIGTARRCVAGLITAGRRARGQSCQQHASGRPPLHVAACTPKRATAGESTPSRKCTTGHAISRSARTARARRCQARRVSRITASCCSGGCRQLPRPG